MRALELTTHWTCVFSFLLSYRFSSIVGRINQVKCHEGSAVSFRCPCCPEEIKDCRFKKLFQGGYIAFYGKVNQPLKYELDENKTHITLKQCHEDDEGTYVWMCGGCNVNRQYNLEFNRELNVESHVHLLQCHHGGSIRFERSCPEDLSHCKFKKADDQVYIMRNGVLSDLPRFELDERRDHITLRRCNEADEGIYVWICEKSKTEKMIRLEILHAADSNRRAFSNTQITSANTRVLFIISLLCWRFLTGSVTLALNCLIN